MRISNLPIIRVHQAIESILNRLDRVVQIQPYCLAVMVIGCNDLDGLLKIDCAGGPNALQRPLGPVASTLARGRGLLPAQIPEAQRQ